MIPPETTPVPIRVLIVDDSAFMRRELTRLFDEHPDFEVVATAPNGIEGVRKTTQFHPDAVTLDVEMPEMNGLQALPLILKACSPKPKIMMCSSLTKDGSHEALQALKLGASDVIAKEGSAITGVPRDPNTGVVPRLRALFPTRLKPAKLDKNDKPRPTPEEGSKPRPAPICRKRDETSPAFGERKLFDLLADGRGFQAVVVGSSTGGPPVLEDLVSRIPSNPSVPIVIAQHMPATFTESLSERIANACRAEVIHAVEPVSLEKGKIYVIKGGLEGRLENRYRKQILRVGEASASAIYRPSVDALFESAAKAFGGNVAAFQLTGMGHDGLEGAKQLRSAGAVIACQDAESCVVWGMPRAVQEAGLADAALPPATLSRALGMLCALMPARDAA